MTSSIAGGVVNFARDPAKAMGDAVSSSVSFLGGCAASDAVAVGETVAEGLGSAASAIGDAVVKAHTHQCKSQGNDND